MSTVADRLLQGDRSTAAELAESLLKPQRDNLVERPWGGTRLVEFKNLASGARSGRTIGESFEIAADDADHEARQHPSVLGFADGSTISLPALLAVHADTVLGEPFVHRYGRRWPLLPKLLDIADLLSVQAHPPGNTEAYVIVAADPGASIRLGFAADIDARAWAAKLATGRREQQRLVELVAAATPDALQTLLKPWLARQGAPASELEAALRPLLSAGARWGDVEQCLVALRDAYWIALDSLNTVPVEAGDVIHNANPPRIVTQSGKLASAEVHALGNPEGRGLLALEIRRPGITLRAWDNVRFPLRDIDIDATLDALNFNGTRPEEFAVELKPVRLGVRRSVDSEYFRLEHLEPGVDAPVNVPSTAPHCLHALAGSVSVRRSDGAPLGTLERGESALVPAQVGAYRVELEGGPAHLVKVELPPYGA